MKGALSASLVFLLVGIGLGRVSDDPAPDTRLVLTLVAAVLTFAGVVFADELRVTLWVRQEKWKVRREAYSEVLRSLSEMGAGIRELGRPAIPDAVRLAAIQTEARTAFSAFLNARAAAAIVDPKLFEIVDAGRSKREAHSAAQDLVTEDFLQRQQDIANRQAGIDCALQAIERRLGPLTDKEARSIDYAEDLTSHETDALSRLRRERAEVHVQLEQLGHDRRVFTDLVRTAVRELKSVYLKWNADLEAEVLAAARESNLEP